MTFQPKGMWESTKKLEREAYAAGKAARCAELTALRKLEQAVRACGLPAIMCTGEAFMRPIVKALAEVDEARGGK
jgi:hypothetical protein